MRLRTSIRLSRRARLPATRSHAAEVVTWPQAQGGTSEIVDEKRAYRVWDEIDEDAWAPLLSDCAPTLRFRSKGKSYVGHCPSPEHSDEKPSFHVTPSARIAKCFSCGWCRTNPIALISALRQASAMEEASYTDAARYLRKKFVKLKDLISDDAIKALDEIEVEIARVTPWSESRATYCTRRSSYGPT